MEFKGNPQILMYAGDLFVLARKYEFRPEKHRIFITHKQGDSFKETIEVHHH